MSSAAHNMNDLWKKEADGVTYVDIFKHVPSNSNLPDPVTLNPYQMLQMQTDRLAIGHEKGNAASSSKRAEGNIYFKINQTVSALLVYNRSLSVAEIGSEEMALAYANRSACYFELKMYDKCLIDIDLACEANYPERLKPKLEVRRVECFKRLEKGDQYQENLPKLDYDDNKDYPGLANVLEIQYNEKFGRHIVANCDIEVGKIVIVEKAFVMTTTPELISWPKYCETCFQSANNFIPCKKCPKALFCDQKCMEDDKFHRITCGKKFPYSTSVLCIIKSVLNAVDTFSNVETLKEFVESIVAIKNRMKQVPPAANDEISKYRMFLSMFIYARKNDWWIVLVYSRNTYDYLIKLPTIRQKFKGDEKKRFLMHLCVMHAAVMLCNKCLNAEICASFILKNFLNHSCAPNLLFYKCENKAVCVTSRPIKKGDQLFIPYGKDSTRQRIVGLFDEYYFKCQCVRCQLRRKWPISSSVVKADPDYQFVFNRLDGIYELVVIAAQKNIWLTSALIEKCFELLKKYGDLPWNEELDFILYRLRGLLTEKVVFSPANQSIQPVSEDGTAK